MLKLINKGQFRERANRSQKYDRSENQITQLKSHLYDNTKRLTEDHNNKKTSDQSQGESPKILIL